MIRITRQASAQLGSPLKVHTAFMEFEKYLNKTTFQAGMNLVGAGAPGGQGSTNRIYIENITLEGVQDAGDLLRQLQEMV